MDDEWAWKHCGKNYKKAYYMVINSLVKKRA